MEKLESKNRIESIDLLKGLVMVIMALDHTRDYFHYSAYFFDPADPTQSNLATFFTRWITHFCAPAFSFLAGVSAFMVGKRKTKNELSAFLLKRGLWLVFIELSFVTFGWYFDVQFQVISLITIWSLGISMIVLAALIHAPKNIILAFCLILIFGHNLLDGIHFESVFWSILHEFNVFSISENRLLLVGYPLIPWVAVMALGYYFGSFYNSNYQPAQRRKLFNWIGSSAVLLFFVIRAINVYGDLSPWQLFDSFIPSLISFMNPTKYPPSLSFILMTLGPTLIFLANSENLKGRVVNFFSIFGRVPFFYYIIHIYLIHLLAMIFAQVTGFGWQIMVLPFWVTMVQNLQGYGVGLPMVYIIWICVILALYPFCKRFDNYKINNKSKWWLSYL